MARTLFRTFLLLCACVVAACVLLLLVLAVVRWRPNNDAGLSIEPLKKFAADYSAYKPNDIAPNQTYSVLDKCWLTPPSLGADVEKVLRRRIVDREYHRSVALIFMKSYNCHYEHSSGGLPLGDGPTDTFWNTDPLYLAYEGMISDEPIDYVTTADVIGWVSRHKDMIDDPDMIAQLRLTCRLHAEKEDRLSLCDDPRLRLGKAPAAAGAP